MAIFLNLSELASIFLCLDQPIVINAIAIKLIKGCSIDVKRNAASFILNPERPKGEIKYKIIPTKNCICVAIKPKRAIFLSLAVNSLFEEVPKALLTTANTNKIKAKYAHPE